MSARRATSAIDQVSRFHSLSRVVLDEINNYNVEKLKIMFLKLEIKLEIAKRNLWFVSTCIKDRLEPSFLNRFGINHLRVNAGIRKKFILNLLQSEKRRWYSVRDNLSHYIRFMYDKLSRVLLQKEKALLDKIASDKIKAVGERKRVVMIKKLDIIRNKNNNTTEAEHNDDVTPFVNNNNNNVTLPANSPHSFHGRTVILTNNSVSFTDDELALLDRGLKYYPKNTPRINEITDLAVTLDSFHFNTDITAQCATIIKNTIKQSSGKQVPYKELNTMNKLKTKIKEKELIVVKADKGNATVVLHKQDYVDKVKTFLKENNFKLSKEDPTQKLQKKVRGAVKNCPHVFDERTRPSLINMNSHAPRLYGAPKVHKPGIPIRPIVAFCSSPTEKLAKALNKEFRTRTNFKAYDSIKNSSELTSKIQSVTFSPTTILVSFDVTNLYTSIPPASCLKLMKRILDKYSHDKIVNAEIMELLSLCLDMNYAVFQSAVYNSNDGLAMGSPLSCVAAEVFMHYFSKEFVHDHHNPYFKYIKFWCRYVDDILCFWTGTVQELNGFLGYLNGCIPSIKFTMELEDKGSLNYLDLTLTKQNDTLQLSIFRKATSTDTVLHATSHHPWTHKMAAFHSYVHRLLNTPLQSDAFEKEKSTLRCIARNNGYDPNLIDSLIKRKRRHQALGLITSNVTPVSTATDPRWYTLPYIGPATIKITNCLKQHGKQVAIRPIHSLRRELSHVKDGTKLVDKSGVYLIKCGAPSCNMNYVGQTGRSLGVRLAEHIRGPTSNFYKHVTDCGHENGDHQVAVLHFAAKGEVMSSLENLEIRRSQMRNADESLNDRREGGESVILFPLLATSLRRSVFFKPLTQILHAP